MKNKKGNNSNFAAIQNVTHKSKGFLRSTFGTLFTAVDKLCKKKNVSNEANFNELVDTNPNEENKIQDIIQESFTQYDNTYEPKYIVSIENNNVEFENELSEDGISFQNIISNNLEEQKNDIDGIKEEFNQADVKDKRSVLVTGIHNFLSKTINIEIDSLSLDNKITEILCTTIVLNNRLRSIRQILRKENKNISYYDNSIDINNRVLCLEKANELIDDTMNQIKNLKQEFIMEFYYDMDRYPETNDIMTEFSSIEYQITSKERELKDILETE